MDARPIVVDASAAISIVRGEDKADAVRAILERSGHRLLIVPDSFWLEVTNVLARRYGYRAEEVLDAVIELDALGLQSITTGRAGILEAVAITVEHGLAAYDAVYLALADAADAEILTLDRRLAAAAGGRSVRIAGEIGEFRGPYRLEPWIEWDRATAYVAAVREATLAEARR